jgi:hypothetical protein
VVLQVHAECVGAGCRSYLYVCNHS